MKYPKKRLKIDIHTGEPVFQLCVYIYIHILTQSTLSTLSYTVHSNYFSQLTNTAKLFLKFKTKLQYPQIYSSKSFAICAGDKQTHRHTNISEVFPIPVTLFRYSHFEATVNAPGASTPMLSACKVRRDHFNSLWQTVKTAYDICSDCIIAAGESAADIKCILKSKYYQK